MTLNIFSMFTGIGGFELGIENSTLKNRHHTKPELVGYSEIDKYAIQIFEKHFEGVKNFGDATQIRGDELPDFDVLVGGFPCQAFSIAGKREGFGDTRGTLFFDIARILHEKRPRYLVLENVRGLLSHDEGKTFQTILRVLADLGYAVEWQVLNSKDFGVPQNRERIFIVGYLGGFPRRALFSIRGSSEDDNGSIDREPSQREPLIRIGRKANIKKDPQTAGTLSVGGHGSGNHSDMDLIVQNEGGRVLKELTQGKSQGERVYDPSGLSVTLASQAGGLGAKTGLYQVENHRIRRLTPVECERLQGFPDGWTEGFSDTRRYKTLGNAVTTNVITALFNALAETIALEEEIAA
jgi:DNA (cytosine-5)-methyltransferase 1